MSFLILREEVGALLTDLVQKLESSCQFLYWQVTRGTSPRNHLFPGEGVSSNLYVYSKPWKGVQMSDEYRLISIPDTRFYHCNIKTLNLIPNVMAAQQASEAGCNETVFVRDGYVTECSHSNISMVKDGVFITHPLDNLILPGTERKHIIRWCGELGIPVKERAFTLEELYTADEILVTSTSHPSMRAMELNQKAVGMKNRADSETAGQILKRNRKIICCSSFRWKAGGIHTWREIESGTSALCRGAWRLENGIRLPMYLA